MAYPSPQIEGIKLDVLPYFKNRQYRGIHYEADALGKYKAKVMTFDKSVSPANLGAWVKANALHDVFVSSTAWANPRHIRPFSTRAENRGQFANNPICFNFVADFDVQMWAKDIKRLIDATNPFLILNTVRGIHVWYSLKSPSIEDRNARETWHKGLYRRICLDLKKQGFKPDMVSSTNTRGIFRVPNSSHREGKICNIAYSKPEAFYSGNLGVKPQMIGERKQ
jgi:hypothetical protein